jgi:large repetitive protein
VTAVLTPDAPAAGEPAAATITVRNDGEGAVEGLRLTDQVSPGVMVRSGSSPAGGCSIASRRADCPLGSLAPGDSVTTVVRLLLDPEPASRTVGQRITLSATGQEQVADRSLSTLVDAPVEQAQVLGVPGTVVTLVAFVGFVLAARSR